MTISRTQIQQLRDMARQDAYGHDGDIDLHLNRLSTALDVLDAVLARDGIESIWGHGGRHPQGDGRVGMSVEMLLEVTR